MSNLMLLVVLRMPPELWTGEAIDVTQRHARYIDAADRIEAQQSKIATLTEQAMAQDKWISVDERPVEEKSHGYSDWILVSTRFGDNRFVCQDKRDFHERKWVNNSENVTHWMPLPTPPKEAE